VTKKWRIRKALCILLIEDASSDDLLVELGRAFRGRLFRRKGCSSPIFTEGFEDVYCVVSEVDHDNLFFAFVATVQP
jgi:hypothetical protein